MKNFGIIPVFNPSVDEKDLGHSVQQQTQIAANVKLTQSTLVVELCGLSLYTGIILYQF